ncbi:hypothetical protein HMPREF1246_0703 [Acidaminococcus sp. BV3L6]|nr:hypothetical protein HMPREF1246_0703 [Acidaminococcus sp. BV3L6]
MEASLTDKSRIEAHSNNLIKEPGTLKENIKALTEANVVR